MDRRTFLAAGAASAAAACCRKTLARLLIELKSSAPQQFTTDNADLQSAYNGALKCLRENSVRVFRFPDPVLIEGSVYRGVWLECAPLEGMVYSLFDAAAGIANHKIFFDLQREDGYLPCSVKADTIGYGQIQMVVPIAATALEIFERFGDSQFLESAYRACSAWDAWLMRYRNTRGTGLCEGILRIRYWARQQSAMGGRAETMPGSRRANYAACRGIAAALPGFIVDSLWRTRGACKDGERFLGKRSDVDRWENSAHAIQKLILEKLYVADDGAFTIWIPKINLCGFAEIC